MPPRVEVRRSDHVVGRGVVGTQDGAARVGRGRGIGRGADHVGSNLGQRESVVPEDPPVVVEEEVVVDSPAGMATVPVDPRVQASLFSEFVKRKPPTFVGVLDPIQALEFLDELEAVFQPLGVRGAMKTAFAAYQLKAGARNWWKLMRRSLGAGDDTRIEWEAFESMFRKKYCLSKQMRDLERELLHMEQGERSVTLYEERFSELSRLLPGVHGDEETRVLRFQDGLRSELRHPMELSQFHLFHEVVDAALRMEANYTEGYQVEKRPKFSVLSPRSFGETAQSGSRRFDALSDRPPISATYSSVQRRPARSTGYQGRSAQAPAGMVCYHCGRSGHRVAVCPMVQEE